MKASSPRQLPAELFSSSLPYGGIRTMAQGRNLIGRFAEEIVISILGLTPCVKSGNYDICFDAVQGEEDYKEIKALKLGKALCIYAWRLNKEIRFPKASYLILRHGACLSEISTMSELARWMLSTSTSLWSIPVPLLDRYIRRHGRLEKHSPASLAKLAGRNHGNVRGHYADGFYRIRETALWDAFCWEPRGIATGEVYGQSHSLELVTATRIKPKPTN